jgi:hypothetical protein
VLRPVDQETSVRLPFLGVEQPAFYEMDGFYDPGLTSSQFPACLRVQADDNSRSVIKDRMMPPHHSYQRVSNDPGFIRKDKLGILPEQPVIRSSVSLSQTIADM